ncbi:hypothetical protein Cgig2_026011 [Carnegiea gigantea]|uniref:Uncharacterized protein n=1 Tax=Carnegiea gigantea TaxID=171969 RepID=A0A9Q1K2M4_9CARY|nr:hypothetical protein Cgig2_026011 [Carnegiea gigantea]
MLHATLSGIVPLPLPNDFQALCPSFVLAVTAEAAQCFQLPELPQVIPTQRFLSKLRDGRLSRLDRLARLRGPTFYAMLLNDAVELGVVSGPMAVDLKLTLEGLRWLLFESWLVHPYSPHARDGIMINEAMELELSSMATLDRMMSDLQELKWDIIEAWLEEVDKRLRDAQLPCLVKILTNPQPCADVTSRLKGAPRISSDEE